MARKRYSSQYKQEQISRDQLSERIKMFGWIPTSISIDLGEDFLVHIYLDDKATGITFHLQEKSVTNLLDRNINGFISYPIKIKDLKHWEDFLEPVVLFIWDVNLREGRWEIIQNIIPQLDSQYPQWRSKKDTSTISVKIPWKNNTDDPGFNLLKRTIGRFCYPLISKGKQLQAQMTIAFPQNPQGRNLSKGLDDFIREGTPISLQGEYIKDFSFPDWWARWFGDVDLDSLVIELESVPKIYEVAIQVISQDKNHSQIINTELKLFRAGTDLLRFSNAHKISPLKCELDIRFSPTGISGNVSFSITIGGVVVLDAMHAISFLKTIQEGGKICFDFAENNEQFSFGISTKPSGEIIGKYVSWIDKLSVVQNKTGVFFRIPEKGLSSNDGQTIDELYNIVTTGNVKLSNTIVTLQLKGNALRRLLIIQQEGKPAPRFRITYPESNSELFGKKIDLGPTVHLFQGEFATSLEEFEKIVGQSTEKEYIPVVFKKVEIKKSFPYWI